MKTITRQQFLDRILPQVVNGDAKNVLSPEWDYSPSTDIVTVASGNRYKAELNISKDEVKLIPIKEEKYGKSTQKN